MIAHEAPKTSGFGAEIASTIQVQNVSLFLLCVELHHIIVNRGSPG